MMKVERGKRYSCIVWIRRTRWRFVLGRFRFGFNREHGSGTLGLPLMLVHWITRNQGAPN